MKQAIGRAVHRHSEASARHEREIGTVLRADHDELEAVAKRLVQAISDGDREDVGVTIALMQARVLEHLDGEEKSLLDGFGRYAPEDAKQILREHAQIRRALAEFDVGVDLHLVRADAVQAFLTALQAHAARENAGLYRWAATAEEPLRTP